MLQDPVRGSAAQQVYDISIVAPCQDPSLRDRRWQHGRIFEPWIWIALKGPRFQRSTAQSVHRDNAANEKLEGSAL